MVQDAIIVLGSDLTYGAKYGALAQITWEWTEANGKYDGCRYWTKMAFMHYLAERSFKGLRHEHVVPKRVVIKMMLALNHPTIEAIQEICERFLIGVVVTIEEDALLNCEYRKSMPPAFWDAAGSDFRNPWLRYRCFPMIEVFEPADRWIQRFD